MAGEPGQRRPARHGHHVDGRGAGRWHRRPGRARPGQRRGLAGLRVLRRSPGPGDRGPQPGRGADAPRRDHRGRSGRSPPAPHPDPGPRRVLRGRDGHVGTRAAHRRPGPPVLRRAEQRGGDRRDVRHHAHGRRSRAGGTPPGRGGQRARGCGQHHRRHRGRAGGRGGAGDGRQDHAHRARRDRRRACAADGRRAGAVPAVGRAPDASGASAVSDLTGSYAAAPGGAPTAAVGIDDTLAPGVRLGFGDEPATLAGEGPHSDEFFMATATSVPVARSTDAGATRTGAAPRTDREGEPRRAAPAPRDPAACHAPGDRVHPPDGRRTGGGVLRAALVRLRQLDSDPAGEPSRGQAGPGGRRAVVPPQGRVPAGRRDHDQDPVRCHYRGARRHTGALVACRQGLYRPSTTTTTTTTTPTTATQGNQSQAPRPLAPSSTTRPRRTGDDHIVAAAP